MLASLPELKAIAFNGKKAAGWFKRWVEVDTSGLRKLVLPFTSPAAAMAFEKKSASFGKRQEYIDYVLTHELCHLKQLNHGAEFYELLSRVMPNWQEKKVKLVDLILGK